MNKEELTQEVVEKIISAKKEVNGEGYVNLKVNSVHYLPEDDRTIINLAGRTPFHTQEAIRLFGEGDLDAAANQGLSAGLRPTDFIPAKGEIVKCMIEEVTTGNGVTGLFITSVTPLPVMKASKSTFSFSAVPANEVEA